MFVLTFGLMYHSILTLKASPSHYLFHSEWMYVIRWFVFPTKSLMRAKITGKGKGWAHQDMNIMYTHAWPHIYALTHTCLSECTYIDVILLVALVQVVHNGGLVQLGQRWHVLHSIDAGLVHSVHPLPGDLGLLEVQHLEDDKTYRLSNIIPLCLFN